MMAYATRTTVPVNKTKQEVETLLTRNGAKKIATFTEDVRAAVMFEMRDRRVRFVLSLPKDDGRKATDQKRRSRWRALLLCIKAKLESVESGIETFEESFLAHVVLDDGKTVYEHTAPRIAQIASTGKMVPLLPASS